MPTTIDVLLPVNNAENYLEDSLESLLRQTFADFRVIVLDDGSSDDSLAVARRVAERDHRIEVIARPRCGLVETLNHGLSLVTAPYMARQDADDISVPGRFAMQLDFLRRHPDISAVAGKYFDMDRDGHPIGIRHHLIDPAAQLDPFAIPAAEPYLSHPFLFMPTAALRAVGGYRHIPHAEDADLYWRLMLRGRLVNLPEVLGLYRQHRQSVSALNEQNVMIQAFSAQLAALSYRRVIAGRPDFAIGPDLAAAIGRAPSIELMAAEVGGLDESEHAYLICAAYTKAIETMTSRGVPFGAPFLVSAMAAYVWTRPVVGNRARQLRRRVWRGIRRYARQRPPAHAMAHLIASYLRDIWLEPLRRVVRRHPLQPNTLEMNALSRDAAPAPRQSPAHHARPAQDTPR